MILQRDMEFEQQLKGTGCGVGLGGSGQGLSASAWEMPSSTSCRFFPIGKKRKPKPTNQPKTQHRRKSRREGMNHLIVPKQGEQKVENPRESNLLQISNLALSQQGEKWRSCLSLRQFSFGPCELGSFTQLWWKSTWASLSEEPSWDTQVLEEDIKDEMSYWKPPKSEAARGRAGSIDSALLPLITAGKPGTVCPFHCCGSVSDLETDSSFDFTSALQNLFPWRQNLTLY